MVDGEVEAEQQQLDAEEQPARAEHRALPRQGPERGSNQTLAKWTTRVRVAAAARPPAAARRCARRAPASPRRAIDGAGRSRQAQATTGDGELAAGVRMG